MEKSLRVAAFSIGGLLIFTLFSAVLIVAMSQQKIAATVAEKTEFTYDEAYEKYVEKDRLETDQKSAEGQITQLRNQLEEDRKQFAQFLGSADILRERFYSIGRAGLDRRFCPDSFASEDTKDDFGPSPESVALALQRCPLNDAAYKQLGISALQIEEVLQTDAKVREQKTAIEIKEEKLATEQAKLESSTNDLKDIAAINRAFAPQERLERFGFGLELIFELPPTILPMILTFVSGLFGSLLINLILIVYPGNKFSIYEGERFVQHVILGGLIAVAVYVVVGAGASVLAISGNTPTPNNFLTFSAIGLFAGMFSDRAAKWLTRNIPFNAPDDDAQTDNEDGGEKGDASGGKSGDAVADAGEDQPSEPLPAAAPSAPPPTPIPAAPSP